MKEHHFYDRSQLRQVQRLLPGDYAAKRAGQSDVIMMMTVLGSCVAVCLTDKARQIAGLNHFMLPDQLDYKALRQSQLDPSNPSARYGVHAMELLINQMLDLGAERAELRAWVFGGAKVLSGISDVGSGNISFALSYLKRERITVVAQDTGGQSARKLYLDASICIPACFPVLRQVQSVQSKEAIYAKQLVKIQHSQQVDISLFGQTLTDQFRQK